MKNEIKLSVYKNKKYKVKNNNILPPFVYESLLLPAVNEENKLKLLKCLRSSLSLDVNEKLRVINEMPNLSEFQVYELIKVFNNERERFLQMASVDIKKINRIGYKNYIGNETLSKQETVNKLISKRDMEWDEIILVLKKRILTVTRVSIN